MGAAGSYEFVEPLDGPLWRVRGPDLVSYTLLRVAGDELGPRPRHLRVPGMTALVDHGPGFLVYEDVTGTDLATEVRRHGPLTGDRLARVLRVSVRVLVDLHRAGVTHGGLCPERVFLDGNRVVVAGPDFGTGGDLAADLAAWADLARFAATGDGATPMPATLADLVIDCSCLPVDRRPPAIEVCRRVELLAAAQRGDAWADLGRRLPVSRWRPSRRVPRPLVRAYDEMFGSAPFLEFLYELAAHDEREGTAWGRGRRGDRVAWTSPDPGCGPPGAEVTMPVEVRNRGRVQWRNRFLRRTGPRWGPHILDTPELFVVPDVPPDGVATVLVRAVLPGGPGMYAQRLTLVDEDGRCRLPRAEASVLVRAHVRVP